MRAHKESGLTSLNEAFPIFDRCLVMLVRYLVDNRFVCKQFCAVVQQSCEQPERKANKWFL